MRDRRPCHGFAGPLGGGIGDHRDRSSLDCLIDETVAVRRLPVNGHENGSWLDLPRIVFHTMDAGVPVLGENLGAIQQMLEGHC